MSLLMPYARLKPSFLHRIQLRPGGWPVRDRHFRPFFRKKLHRELRFEPFWSAMKAGEAVPLSLVEGFVEYVNLKWGWKDVSVETASEPAAPVLNTEHRDGWTTLPEIVRLVGHHFSVPEEASCNRPSRDIPYAADMIVTCAGRRLGGEGDLADEEGCRRKGEREMGRTVEQFTEWLFGTWDKEPRCVMFPTGKGTTKTGRRWVRVAASVVLPLAESAFTRLSNGEIAYYEITPADVQSPSRFIHFNAMGEPAVLDGISHAQATRVEAICAFYQVAYLSRSTRARSGNPVLVAVGASPFIEARLARMGFRHNGKYVPGLDKKPIMILRHPKECEDRLTTSDKVAYHYHNFMFKLFRFFNRKQWRREDKQRDTGE